MSLKTYKKSDGTSKCAPRFCCSNQSRCNTGSCMYEEILDRVCEVLQNCIEDFEVRVENDEGNSYKLHANLVKNLEKKLKDLEAKELAQWESQAHPDPAQRMPAEIFKRLNEKLLQEKEDVRQALCKAYDSMPEPIDYEEKIVQFQTALDALRNPDMDDERKNDLLKACIERIEYYKAKPERTKAPKEIATFPMTGRGTWTTPPIELDIKLKV